MKAVFRTALFLATLAHVSALAQEIDASIVSEERSAGGNPQKKYFLLRHKLEAAQSPKEFGLLLILPGGPGSADFLPFCANILTAVGTPPDVVVAELVAPVWKKVDASTVVWPSKAFPVKEARFTTEQFVEDVIKDVSKTVKVHDGWIFMLGWSSSGHVLYSTAIENPKVRGFFVAMSRFRPEWFHDLNRARGNDSTSGIPQKTPFVPTPKQNRQRDTCQTGPHQRC
jgi:hypothetical protein